VDDSLDLSEFDNTFGREFENFLIQIFEKLGYSATVTNRSKDYGSDIMLQQMDQRIAVQAMRSKHELNFTSVQRVLDSSKKYGSKTSIVVTNNKFLLSAKNLAKIKNVTLIDRGILLKLIQLSNLSVNHNKDLFDFCNLVCNNAVKKEIDKNSFKFLGLDDHKIDHSLLTKNTYGRSYPENNKKEKLIDIFQDIRGENDLSVKKDILLDFMGKYPLMFGSNSESELFLVSMIKQFVIFSPKIDYYNLV